MHLKRLLELVMIVLAPTYKLVHNRGALIRCTVVYNIVYTFGLLVIPSDPCRTSPRTPSVFLYVQDISRGGWQL